MLIDDVVEQEAPSQGLPRRAILGGLLGAAGAAALSTRRATADAYQVSARIRPTFDAAGGARVLGPPVSREVEVAIAGTLTYAQRFVHGTVWWGSGVGRFDLPRSTRVRLATAPNFRPVAGVPNVWRSDEPDGCTALEKRIVGDLGISTMVAVDSGSDPAIAGVRNLRYHLVNHGGHLTTYRRYVTRHANRKAIGKVLKALARSDRPLLVHCRSGRDRTGWLSDLMQAVAGVSVGLRDEDYLATRDYTGLSVDLDWLGAARDQVTESFGDVETYLIHGCGLSGDRYAALRTRLTG